MEMSSEELIWLRWDVDPEVDRELHASMKGSSTSIQGLDDSAKQFSSSNKVLGRLHMDVATPGSEKKNTSMRFLRSNQSGRRTASG